MCDPDAGGPDLQSVQRDCLVALVEVALDLADALGEVDAGIRLDAALVALADASRGPQVDVETVR